MPRSGAAVWISKASISSWSAMKLYLKCTRIASGGAVVASVVAAVEDGDAIDLTPHHIAEIRVCGGTACSRSKKIRSP